MAKHGNGDTDLHKGKDCPWQTHLLGLARLFQHGSGALVQALHLDLVPKGISPNGGQQEQCGEQQAGKWFHALSDAGQRVWLPLMLGRRVSLERPRPQRPTPTVTAPN
jgi:hypothetical protein